MQVDEPAKWIVAEAIQSALQAPLYHLIVEGILLLWIVRLLFFKSYKIHDNDPLNAKEQEDLVNEWTPEPLVPPLGVTLKDAVPYRFVSGSPDKMITIDGNHCLNFASMNFLGLLGNKRIQHETKTCIRKYGVGSCGPRGFYGTIDVHLELEERLAKFMGSEQAIIYSYGFATVSSAIPAYAKRGDILFVDEAVYFAVQKGIQASRSVVVYFKHNDMADLEDKLKKQEEIDKKDPKKASVTRKFIIVEGIYMNTGQICDLSRLVELKYKYKVRLFIEESLSFGVLGARGRGVTEHFDVPIEKVDMICASLEYSLASIGGFCCGRKYVIGHQQLSGQGYVFSASLPPLMSRACIEGLNIIEESPELFSRLQSKASKFQQLLSKIESAEITGYPESPSFHIRRKIHQQPRKITNDLKFLRAVVDECAKNGVCVTVASRLSQVELQTTWPPSIRVAVSVHMDDDDLRCAADVIQQAFEVVDGRAKIQPSVGIYKS